MKEQIENWLRFENFAAGVQLLAKYNQRPELVAKYKGLPNGTAMQRAELLAAMRSILRNGIENVQPVPENQTAPKPITPKSAIFNKQHDKCKLLLKKRADLHSRLKAAITDEERYNLATQIKELTKKIDAAYDVLRHVEETGQLPMSETDEAQLIRKGIEMVKQLQSLKTQLSQARKANDVSKEQLLNTQIEELNAQIEGYDK